MNRLPWKESPPHRKNSVMRERAPMPNPSWEAVLDREEPGMSCGPGLKIGAEQIRAWTGLSWVLSDRTA